jgi:hypothetical protein
MGLYPGLFWQSKAGNSYQTFLLHASLKERFAVLAESCKSFPQSLSTSDTEIIKKLPSVKHEKLNELIIKGLNIL